MVSMRHEYIWLLPLVAFDSTNFSSDYVNDSFIPYQILFLILALQSGVMCLGKLTAFLQILFVTMILKLASQTLYKVNSKIPFGILTFTTPNFHSLDNVMIVTNLCLTQWSLSIWDSFRFDIFTFNGFSTSLNVSYFMNSKCIMLRKGKSLFQERPILQM